MTPPPIVCPHPGPHNPGPDCPLWDARQRIQFQRSLEVEAAAHRGLGALVWADFNRSYQRPPVPPTRPTPISPSAVPALTDPAEPVVLVTEKGVLNHA